MRFHFLVETPNKKRLRIKRRIHFNSISGVHIQSPTTTVHTIKTNRTNISANKILSEANEKKMNTKSQFMSTK